MEQPRVGTHYPRSTPASSRPGSALMQSCLDYLDWVRWPGWSHLPVLRTRGGLAAQVMAGLRALAVMGAPAEGCSPVLGSVGLAGAPMTASALIPAITEPPAPRVSAGRAGETTRPAHPVQVVQAVCISAEPGLELASRPRVMGADTRLLHTPSLLRLSKYPRRSVNDTQPLTSGEMCQIFSS